MTYRGWAVLGLLLLSTPLRADELIWRPEGAADIPTVLTPARLRQPQSEVPASVTVIDRTLIDASGARELYQVLRLVPGMVAVKADGNVPTVAYHGTLARDTRRMLVLVDGRSVYQPGFSRVLWNDIPVDLNDVERIEVTRGPNAAAYGANAFTGIVNIITRHPQDMPGGSVMLRGGNNGVRDARLTDVQHWAGGGVRTTVARRADDGYDKPFRGREIRDGKVVETLDVRLSHDLNRRDSVDVMLGGARSDLARLEEGALLDFAEVYGAPDETSQSVFAQARWQRVFSPDHALRLQVYGQHTDGNQRTELCPRDIRTGAVGPGGALLYSREMRDLFEATGRDTLATVVAAATPGTDAAIDQRYAALVNSGAGPFCHRLQQDVTERRVDIEIEDTVRLHERVRLVTGGSLRRDEARSDALLDGSVSNQTRALFGNLELIPLNSVHVNLGGYWQWDQINSGRLSPRAAVIWRPAPGHGVRLVYSEAVRNVDIYEERANTALRPALLPATYAADTVGLLGWADPQLFVTQTSPGDLKPERIRSREIGYFGRAGQFELDVRVFDEALRDLISQPTNPFRFEANNDTQVTQRGWESQLAWRPHPRHLLRGTYARRHGDAPIVAETRLFARHMSSMLWRYDFRDGWMFSSSYYLARRYDDFTYEQLSAQLMRRQRLGRHELSLAGTVEHNVSGDSIVFRRNDYLDRSRYWLSATLHF
ncbi:TonB-dependent receptor plug domain-containing protein [Isoalcanivorax indicus]|uniref:TonB-dependent receptor plug domain-containing protein n=1 Tax=Isoalcanivorax indicus TaxID=2202653 RepID=UPI000DB92C6F|nr:TonB-dependent receptor [Isoalcanivorax indicus]